jgi:Tfp pilus assembly protein PilF
LALSNTGNLKRATQEWLQSAKLAPWMNEVQLALSQIARSQGDLQLLKTTTETIIRNNPSDPRGYILRAESESGKPATAQADLNKAIQIAPQNPLGLRGDRQFFSRAGQG